MSWSNQDAEVTKHFPDSIKDTQLIAFMGELMVSISSLLGENWISMA